MTTCDVSSMNACRKRDGKRSLVAIDDSKPIGPGNFAWVNLPSRDLGLEIDGVWHSSRDAQRVLGVSQGAGEAVAKRATGLTWSILGSTEMNRCRPPEGASGRPKPASVCATDAPKRKSFVRSVGPTDAG